MKTRIYYHQNSNVVAFERIEYKEQDWNELTFDKNGQTLTFKDSNGYSYEHTRDEEGKEIASKDSDGYYEVKGEEVTKEEYDKFIASLRRPLLGKKVVIDGIEYTLK